MKLLLRILRTTGLLILIPLVGVLIYGLLAAPPGIGQARAEADRCAEELGSASTRPVGEGLPHTLEVLVWNIQKGGDPDWRRDYLALGANAHLLMLQEATHEAESTGLLPQILYGTFSEGYRAGELHTGVLTLSTVEPLLHCSLVAWEPWLATPKVANVSEYPLADSNVRLLTINLHAVNFTVGMEEFRAQMEALDILLHTHQGPVLAAGDFNTWGPRRLRVVAEFMASNALRPVHFEPDRRTKILKRPLDHIYLRDLRAIHSEVVEVDSSDHNPLRVRLVWTP